MTRFPSLETERLLLRFPIAEDLLKFTEFFISDRAKYAGGSASEAKAWSEFAEMIGHWTLRGFGSFVITDKQNGRAIGHVGGVQPLNWPEREVGWSIWNDADEGMGYASEAVKSVINHLFNHLKWDTAVSYIAPDNTRSIKFAERLGAELDDTAEKPEGLRCFVYRHPAPEALQ